jgi:hypothetical protein
LTASLSSLYITRGEDISYRHLYSAFEIIEKLHQRK